MGGTVVEKLGNRALYRRLKPAQDKKQRLGRWPEGQLYPNSH